MLRKTFLWLLSCSVRACFCEIPPPFIRLFHLPFYFTFSLLKLFDSHFGGIRRCSFPFQCRLLCEFSIWSQNFCFEIRLQLQPWAMHGRAPISPLCVWSPRLQFLLLFYSLLFPFYFLFFTFCLFYSFLFPPPAYFPATAIKKIRSANQALAPLWSFCTWWPFLQRNAGVQW